MDHLRRICWMKMKDDDDDGGSDGDRRNDEDEKKRVHKRKYEKITLLYLFSDWIDLVCMLLRYTNFFSRIEPCSLHSIIRLDGSSYLSATLTVSSTVRENILSQHLNSKRGTSDKPNKTEQNKTWTGNHTHIYQMCRMIEEEKTAPALIKYTKGKWKWK